MRPGEKVVFSARTIPGNELAVRKIVNQLARQRVEVVTPDQAPVHASGHARADEQAALIQAVSPRAFVPAYGERAMLEAHARTARELLAPDRVHVVENGRAMRLRAGALELGAREEVSRRPLDEEGRVMDWGDVRDRNRIGRRGLVACSVAVDAAGRRAGAPVVTARGLRIDAATRARLAALVGAALDASTLLTRSAVVEAVRAVLGAELGTGRRAPHVEVLVVGMVEP
jgi:ribonuclease J